MRAAMDAGIEIPKLCATDRLDAFGSCRALPGRDRGPRAARRPPAPRRSREGMVVHTQTDAAATHPPRRDGALHLRPSARLPDLRRPTATASCRTWPARSACARSATARRRATTSRRVQGAKSTACRRTSPTRISPSTRRKCIVCSRCVRACEEVQGTFALTIEGRGFDSRVVGRHGRGLPRLRMRVLRRLRAGLPDRRR